jgi:hypothetical protein
MNTSPFNQMTSVSKYYKCPCGYLTKNKEYAGYHTRDGCKAIEYPSVFEGKSGLIFFSKSGKQSLFGKWYESEEKLFETYDGHEVKFRYFLNCDYDFIKLQTKARKHGLVSIDSPTTVVRNDSAENLFENFE